MEATDKTYQNQQPSQERQNHMIKINLQTSRRYDSLNDEQSMKTW